MVWCIFTTKIGACCQPCTGLIVFFDLQRKHGLPVQRALRGLSPLCVDNALDNFRGNPRMPRQAWLSGRCRKNGQDRASRKTKFKAG